MEGGFQLPNSNFGPMLGASFAGGGMGGATFSDYPFEINRSNVMVTRVVNCRLAGGGVEETCSDQVISMLDTEDVWWIWARIDHAVSRNSSGRMVVQTGTSVPQSTARYTIRTLYKMKKGSVDVDMRWMPVIVEAS